MLFTLLHQKSLAVSGKNLNRLDVCSTSNGGLIEIHRTGIKLGEFYFYLVKISHFYLGSLIYCDRSKIRNDFIVTLYKYICIFRLN